VQLIATVGGAVGGSVGGTVGGVVGGSVGGAVGAVVVGGGGAPFPPMPPSFMPRRMREVGKRSFPSPRVVLGAVPAASGVSPRTVLSCGKETADTSRTVIATASATASHVTRFDMA
jgi:hypothetical protein